MHWSIISKNGHITQVIVLASYTKFLSSYSLFIFIVCLFDDILTLQLSVLLYLLIVNLITKFLLNKYWYCLNEKTVDSENLKLSHKFSL